MRKSIPGLLWLSIAALGIMTVWFLLVGFKGLSAHATLSAGVSEQGDQLLAGFKARSILALLAAILSVLLLVGLVLGRKWGYVLTLVYVLLGIAVAFRQGAPQAMMTIIIFAPVIVPMFICTRFFFPGEMPDSVNEESEPYEA